MTTVRELRLHRKYYDLVVAGVKTVEVRVRYPRHADLVEGDVIRFRVEGAGDTCDVRVTRVTEYADFGALLDGEGPDAVNPTATREEQLAAMRAIYPPEKEALGALAIGIELIGV
ncbi:ASCH domain-containing protein [Streptomyces niveiscabiei]|uniref:ASCH domain-containing protein n=1 Tax=Streptomyces niveiscabiei TaxID=164115 RepID=UPI0029B57FFA|nr:ASCH domain-containing protein [Streptomyces niveiscabiei]MDX3388269.1 ASCH domain-containing protein [Streptomyces niveiscabiei]